MNAHLFSFHSIKRTKTWTRMTFEGYAVPKEEEETEIDDRRPALKRRPQ